MKEPPSDLYELYKNAYKVMSGSSSRKVTFLTDTQVMANPALLDGITAVHMGAIDTVTYMYEELGLILAKHKCSLIDDKNGQPNFLNEYEQPLPEEVQVKLRSKLKNS